MILWPKEDHHRQHSTITTTLPSTDRAVLMGVVPEEGEADDDNEEEHDPNKEVTTTTANVRTLNDPTSLLAWKQQLQQMGVLDTVDHEAFLRPITGTGIFVAAAGNSSSHAAAGRSSTTTKTDSSSVSSFVIDDAVLEVHRVMESLPLTTDCMDEDIAAILFANDDDDDNDQDDPLQDYEEMNDDFMLMATGVIPIDAESGADTDKNNNNDDDDTAPHRPVTTTHFDFDAHIRQLINTAKLGRDHHNNHPGPHSDAEFFAKHWQNTTSSSWNKTRGHENDEPHDGNHRHVTKSRFRSHDDDDDDDYHHHDENSVGGGGSSVFTTTTTTTGAAKLLNPDEERALCDKFAATLAEYDDDSDDDEYGECEEYNEDYPPRHNHNHSNNSMEEDHDDDGITIQSSSLQCATIGRPLVGDAVVEAALDEYLLEREDDILIHGNADRMRRSGGSGFAVLVGKQMINAKVLDNAATTAPSTGPVEELHPEQEPAMPIDEYIAMAQETLLRPKEKPPAEEIFIDGKSYYDERPRNPWDCESILSTYSNLDNNPTTIGQSSTRNRRRKNGKSNNNHDDDRSVVSSVSLTATPNFTPQHIRLSAKTGLPMGVFAREPQHDTGENNNNNNDDDDDDDDDQGDDTYVSVNKGVKRSKDETPDEKRMRKLMIKRERELARIQKKITKEVYNNEMQKHMPMISEDGMAGKTVFRFS